jgi:hypothetical protein
MTLNIHEPPAASAVFQLQVRRIGRSLRPEQIGLAVILGAVAILALLLAIFGDPTLDYPSELNVLIPLGAFLLPFRLWRGERLFDGSDLWLMPVERQKHALIRAAAGAVWAVAAITLVVLTLNLLALAAGSPTIGTSAWQWFAPLGGGLVAYLFGSALVLAVRRPLRWSVGLIAASLLFSALGFRAAVEPLVQAVAHGRLGVERVITGGGSSVAWAVALLFWLGLGLTAVALASLRHRER